MSTLVRTSTLERRARRGARHLDRVGPDDWIEQIDLDHLDIQLPRRCVIGQLYGHYHRHCESVVKRGWLRLLPRGLRSDHLGFSLNKLYSWDQFQRIMWTYQELTDAWRREILRRRAELDSKRTTRDTAE
jgi:hypothetical protein